ncbi:DUF1266 domain-containing protein [Chitinophaga vietnamensis]|uniref:DUF1266 domain-containing protein n=1 Tax=Chitinophaga vietnamensis TaxID=2593957 RepID=UPI0013762071|nr:DUF1266 domain-containing protein [Chitinophaga vietnamensis]
MEPLLQNHPNDRSFPASAKWKYFEKGKQSRPLVYAVAILSFTIALLTAFFLIIQLQTLAHRHYELPEGKEGVQILPLLVFLVFTGIFIAAARHLCLLPVREQQRYYRHSGATLLPEGKRQALRLHLVDTFKHGCWSETLEFYPLAALAGNEKYHAFRPDEALGYRKSLDQDWGILSTEDYRRVAKQLLSQGYHAEPFAVVLSVQDTNHARRKRLADLTSLPESYITECLEQRPDGRPPKLIWGYEYWRLIVVARNAFMAGIITEEEAWKDMLQAAAYAFELFDSYEDFNNNHRLGNAFWCDAYKITSEKTEAWKRFKEQCNWPLARLPWPARRGIALPKAVASGYATEIALARSMNQQPGSLN